MFRNVRRGIGDLPLRASRPVPRLAVAVGEAAPLEPEPVHHAARTAGRRAKGLLILHLQVGESGGRGSGPRLRGRVAANRGRVGRERPAHSSATMRAPPKPRSATSIGKVSRRGEVPATRIASMWWRHASSSGCRRSHGSRKRAAPPSRRPRGVSPSNEAREKLGCISRGGCLQFPKQNVKQDCKTYPPFRHSAAAAHPTRRAGRQRA